MKIHELKVWPEPFKALDSGSKNSEFRSNDMDFHEGDLLCLREWEGETEYTGRYLLFIVSHVSFPSPFYSDMPPVFVVLSLERIFTRHCGMVGTPEQDPYLQKLDEIHEAVTKKEG